MKSIMKYLWLGLAMIAMASCHGYTDPDTIIPDNNDPTEDDKWPNETLAPGEMRIYADKTSIDASGADPVEFRVVLGTEQGNKVVSDGVSNLVISSECDGVSNDLGRGSFTFSTAAVGAYTFTAEYYEGELFETANSVSVVALPVEDGGVNYFQKVMGVQFTSTGCTSCPNLTRSIKTYQEANPGRLIPVSFHQHMPPTSDPMTNNTGEVFFRSFGGQGLPAFYTNMRKSTKLTSEYTALVEAVEGELKNFPSTCGVAIESSYNPETRELQITGKVTSKISQVYRYYVMLLEDGIVADQTGDANYVHNNVMRQGWPADNTTGYYIKSDGSATEPGVEVRIERKPVTLDPSWKTENMRIFFAALVSQDGGMSYTVDNCIDCKLGESVDYAYDNEGSSNKTLTLTADKSSAATGEAINFTVADETEVLSDVATIVNLTTGEKVEAGSYLPTQTGTHEFIAAYDGVVSNRVQVTINQGNTPTPPPSPSGYTNYQRHIAVYEFTAVECTMCPEGFSKLNNLITNPYGGYPTVHVMAFHSHNMGVDPMAIEVTKSIEANFGNMGLPSIVIDMDQTKRGEINNVVGNLTEWWDETLLNETPAWCGLALQSSYDAATRQGELIVKLGVNEPGTWRIALFVVEDGVQSKQKMKNGSYNDTYNHRHVVRQMLSSAYTGDLVGKDLKTGDERTLTYPFTLSEDWNAEKIELYVVAIDETSGQIKNLAYVKPGESVDYDIYE